MTSWPAVLRLPGRPRRNALTAALSLRRRRAQAAEAERAAQAAARSEFLDVARAHLAPRQHSSSPELIPTYEEGDRHSLGRLTRSDAWAPAQGTAFDRDDVT